MGGRHRGYVVRDSYGFEMIYRYRTTARRIAKQVQGARVLGPLRQAFGTAYALDHYARGMQALKRMDEEMGPEH
jgi:hypothetical protein